MQTPPTSAAKRPAANIVFASGASSPLGAPKGDRRFWPISAPGAKKPTSQPVGHLVTIDLDAFPQGLPISRTYSRGKNNAEYWADLACDYIAQYSAALILHKQIMSSRGVPHALWCVLAAAQRDIDGRFKTAIQRHTANGGTRETELIEAWGKAA